VQKLIFDPLIQYAQIKTSRTHTIDEWFKPAEIVSESNNNVIKTKKQETHEIKVKKSKQLSLDKFF